jgi:hypothetical protein
MSAALLTHEKSWYRPGIGLTENGDRKVGMHGDAQGPAHPGDAAGVWARFYAAGWIHFVAILCMVPVILLTLWGLLRRLRLESDAYSCTLARSIDEGELPRFVDVQDSLVPLRSVCRWEDGSTLDLVPAYVNPGILMCAVVSVTAVVVIQVRNRRLGRTHDTD